MWSYYGSKSKVINYYPAPLHNKIIEPFAGSARYALKYWDRDVTIVDKYEVVVRLWKWLQKASEKDILGLPRLKKGQDIRTFNLSEDERLLLGFFVQAGSSMPSYTVSVMGEQNCKTLYSNISSNLHKIKHWEVRHCNYWEIPNQEATWFIDPPYQFGGDRYVHSSKSINFYDLSVWCKSRQGQVIVCENTKADWMDFRPLKDMRGCKHKTTEAIWSNLPTVYDNIQTKLIA